MNSIRITTFLIISLWVGGSLSAQSKIRIQPTYKQYRTVEDSWYPKKVQITTSFVYETDALTVEAVRQGNGDWVLKKDGNAVGSARLNRTEDDLSWDIRLGEKEIHVQIAASSEGANDPREPVITFEGNEYRCFNLEPDANSHWGIYSSQEDQWDGEKPQLEIINNWNYNFKPKNWDDTPEWKMVFHRKDLPAEVNFVFAFQGINAMNVRYGADLR